MGNLVALIWTVPENGNSRKETRRPQLNVGNFEIFVDFRTRYSNKIRVSGCLSSAYRRFKLGEAWRGVSKSPKFSFPSKAVLVPLTPGRDRKPEISKLQRIDIAANYSVVFYVFVWVNCNEP